MNRTAATVLAVAATCASAAAAAVAVASTATTAAGGLSISPAVIEHQATPGSVGQIRVNNATNRTMSVRVRVRPWIQARSGAVETNPRKTLSQVRLGTTSFSLAPGSARTVTATLLKRPSGGSLYGAIEVIGTPKGGATNGIRARYRLLGSLRLNPATAQRRFRVRVGAAAATGSGVTVAVRNAGNTVEPISGAARITSASGTLRSELAGTRILPGAVVDLQLHKGRLRAGSYTAAVTLRQGGRTIATVMRTFRVR
jgi:hypothetical protein